jgi:hypothetical protein
MQRQDQIEFDGPINMPGKANWKLALGLPTLVLVACFLISRSAIFVPGQNILSSAILADILITAPLLYFLAIRKTNVSRWTVARVFILCLLAAGIILNKADNGLLHFIKAWISPLIEFSLIVFISRKFYLANLHAKSAGINNIDFLTHCRCIIKEVTGNEKAGNILSSEIAVFYYALGGRKYRNIDRLQTFSNYRENGIILVLGTFLCLFMIETIGVHFLISLWKPVVAWVFTTLSLYTCLQLFAHIRATSSRPTRIGASALELYNGLAADATIEFDNIEEIVLTKKKPDGGEQVQLALLNGLEPHNVVIRLKKTIVVTKIFGIQKKADVILFHIDRPKEFVKLLNGAIASSH